MLIETTQWQNHKTLYNALPLALYICGTPESYLFRKLKITTSRPDWATEICDWPSWAI